MSTKAIREALHYAGTTASDTQKAHDASARALAEVEAIETRLEIGGRMANVCYNLGQEAGPNLDTSVRRSLAGLAKEWDAAPKT